MYFDVWCPAFLSTADDIRDQRLAFGWGRGRFFSEFQARRAPAPKTLVVYGAIASSCVSGQAKLVHEVAPRIFRISLARSPARSFGASWVSLAPVCIFSRLPLTPSQAFLLSSHVVPVCLLLLLLLLLLLPLLLLLWFAHARTHLLRPPVRFLADDFFSLGLTIRSVPLL